MIDANSVAPAPEVNGRVVDSDRPALANVTLNRSALRNIPTPEPAIERTLDRGNVGLLYGHRGCLKSFIALDWTISSAIGRPWQGRACTQQRALFVAGEGAFGLAQRVLAYEVGWQARISDEDFDVLPRPVNLLDHHSVAELGAFIRWGGYGFITFDTLARCMVGGDENSAKDAGIVIDHLYWLLAQTPGGRGVVLVVTHTGKDQKTLRGSSAFEAGVDVVYSAARDEGAILLNRTKRKDGPELDAHQLRLDLIPGTESGVISAGQPFFRGQNEPRRADELLSVFVRSFVSIGASKSELRSVADMAPATFHRALSELVKRGDLINEGTEKRPFYKAVTR